MSSKNWTLDSVDKVWPVPGSEAFLDESPRANLFAPNINLQLWQGCQLSSSPVEQQPPLGCDDTMCEIMGNLCGHPKAQTTDTHVLNLNQDHFYLSNPKS